MNLHTNIAGLVNTDRDSTIELSWEQFRRLVGDDLEVSFTSGALSIDLTNIEIVVSGTASELQLIFNDLGSTFQYLPASLSFRITDGREVTLNADQSEALDGRLDGSFILTDDSDGIASVLDKALPSTLKDISVNANELGVKELILTVDQFRGLPYYSNEEAITINDSESNIIKAINFGIFDDRVTTLNIDHPTPITN